MSGVLEEEIFETEDVDSDNEDEDRKEVQSAEAPVSSDVVEEKIEPTPAFQKFTGKAGLKTRDISLDGEIIESSTAKDGQFESPLQKYRRLKSEISQFSEQLSDLKRIAETGNEAPTKGIIDKVSREITQLWGNVEHFQGNPELAMLFAEANTNALETVNAGYLMKRLEEFQASSSGSAKGGAAGGSDENKATFTLYHDGSVDNESYRMKELNERLKYLESIIGNASGSSSSAAKKGDESKTASDDSGQKNDPSVGASGLKGGMIRNIEYLHRRLDLLCDQSRLEALKRRVASLKTSLSDIKFETQSTMEEQITKSKERRINTMFEMMERWDQAAHALPTIVNRLHALKSLHHESADMIAKISHMENEHRLIEKTLKENGELLTRVNESLAANAATMQANVQSIDQRIAGLQQKVKGFQK